MPADAPAPVATDPLSNDLTQASREAYGRYPMRGLFGDRGVVRSMIDAGLEASRKQIIADLKPKEE